MRTRVCVRRCVEVVTRKEEVDEVGSRKEDVVTMQVQGWPLGQDEVMR